MDQEKDFLKCEVLEKIVVPQVGDWATYTMMGFNAVSTLLFVGYTVVVYT